MAAKRINQLGDPLLREISTPLPDAASAAGVLEDLRDTLHEFQRTNGFGRGISAVQIGVPVRVIYMEFKGVYHCLINPEFDFLSEEKFRLWDDCFSFPNLLVQLERSVKVRIHYMDETGVRREVAVSGAFSELIQHEMDHLDGILAVDRPLDNNSFCTREEWVRRYR